MSKAYEHVVANGIDAATDNEIRAFRIGFSGSSVGDNPDVLLVTPRDNYALEIKKTKSSGTFYVNGDDIEQLTRCINSHTTAHLVVKFSHREPVTITYYDDVTGSDDFKSMSSVAKMAAVTPDAFDAHVTDGGNLALQKPDPDDWPSAKAGESDEVAILRDLGITNEKSTHV
jgi:Holliday junction resolvase